MSPQPPDEGFIPRVVSEFGLKWSQIAALSGLLFSLLGLDEWFNAGSWTLAAIIALVIIFAFRRFFRWTLPWVAAVSALALALYLAGSWWIVGSPDVLAWLKQDKLNRLIGTFVIGLGVMTAAAAVVLTYRRQEALFGGPYPASVSRALSAAIVDQGFYREDQKYVLTFLEANKRTTRVRIELTYRLVNRTGSRQQAYLLLTPMRPDVKFLEAVAGKTKYDVNDARNKSGAGLRIQVSLKQSEKMQVRLAAEVDYWRSDSDLFATYLPCTSLELVVRNQISDLDIHVEALSPQQVHPKDESDGTRRWKISHGLIPYQGFKVDWIRQEG